MRSSRLASAFTNLGRAYRKRSNLAPVADSPCTRDEDVRRAGTTRHDPAEHPSHRPDRPRHVRGPWLYLSEVLHFRLARPPRHPEPAESPCLDARRYGWPPRSSARWYPGKSEDVGADPRKGRPDNDHRIDRRRARRTDARARTRHSARWHGCTSSRRTARNRRAVISGWVFRSSRPPGDRNVARYAFRSPLAR